MASIRESPYCDQLPHIKAGRTLWKRQSVQLANNPSSLLDESALRRLKNPAAHPVPQPRPQNGQRSRSLGASFHAALRVSLLPARRHAIVKKARCVDQKQLEAFKSAFDRIEASRLKARAVACEVTGGEHKERMLVSECFEMISGSLALPFPTAALQLRGYELIGDIFFIYKDYLSAVLYFCQGVWKRSNRVEIVCGTEAAPRT